MRSFRKQLLAGIADAKQSGNDEHRFEVIEIACSHLPASKILQAMQSPVNDRQIGGAAPGHLFYLGVKSDQRPLLPWLGRMPFLGKRLLRLRITHRFAFRRQPWNAIELKGRVVEPTYAGRPMFGAFNLESLASAA